MHTNPRCWPCQCKPLPPSKVWYGMEQNGLVWYGMVWCGVVWYGMVWYGMVWYGMVNVTQPFRVGGWQMLTGQVVGIPNVDRGEGDDVIFYCSLV